MFLQTVQKWQQPTTIFPLGLSERSDYMVWNRTSDMSSSRQTVSTFPDKRQSSDKPPRTLIPTYEETVLLPKTKQKKTCLLCSSSTCTLRASCWILIPKSRRSYRQPRADACVFISLIPSQGALVFLAIAGKRRWGWHRNQHEVFTGLRTSFIIQSLMRCAVAYQPATGSKGNLWSEPFNDRLSLIVGEVRFSLLSCFCASPRRWDAGKTFIFCALF